MSRLECLIPPPVVMLITALIMWVSARFVSIPSFQIVPMSDNKTIAVVVAIIGIVVAVVAAMEFKRASTTINPMNPDASSHLITQGVYRFSRNPIYLADAIVLIGWGLFLNNALSVALIAVFVIYINRFQIQPEERALTVRFGETYSSYQSSTRRWL